MKELKSLIIVIFGLFITVGASILTMIYGWGLEPKSWLWILVLYPSMQIFAQILVKIAEHDKD